jgi:hypothetical protein
MLLWIDRLVTTVHTGVSPEISGYRYCRYWQYCRSKRPSELEGCTVWKSTALRFILEFKRKCEGRDTVGIDDIQVQEGRLHKNAVLNRWQRYYGLCWSYNGNVSAEVKWMLMILRFYKVFWIRMLYWVDGHVTRVPIGVSTEISGYRYSGYWKYSHSIRTYEL